MLAHENWKSETLDLKLLLFFLTFHLVKLQLHFRTAITLLLLLTSIQTFAQYESDDDPNDPANFMRYKGFYIGVYFGGYFPNKYTASNYDGYGFDLNGNKNNFANSWMNQKINTQYGSTSYGQPDRVADALGVQSNPKEWQFNESDMPNYMKYNNGFLLGINGQYAINKRNAILLNINFVKLNITGSFNMERTKKNYTAPATFDSVLTFGIVGGEQRVLFQLGYQFILTNYQKTNLFVEGGVNVTYTKFEKSQIEINNLTIDLITNYNQFQNPTPTYDIPILRKTGIGYFAGLGLDLVVGRRWNAQIVYQPSYEKVNIGIDPKLTLQHSIGIRAYYRIGKERG